MRNMLALNLLLFGVVWSIIWYVVGGIAPEMMWMLFIGPICIVIGVLVFVTGKLSSRDFDAHAETAPATILKVWQTGMVLNDINPQIGLQLQVQPANRAAFQAETKMFVQMIEIPQLQPGVQVQVQYDTRHPNKLKVESIGGTGNAAAALGGAAMPAGGVEALQQMLLAKDQMYAAVRSMGQAAEATILKVTDMGITVGDAAMMKKLELEVRPTSGPSFHAETQGAISLVSNDKYQPGKSVWVKFNPNDLTQVALDHS